jgi:hypothetical protein
VQCASLARTSVERGSLMILITPAGMAALSVGPVTGLTFKLGDSFGYVPSISDTNIRGNLILQGMVSDPVVAGPGIYKYTINLSALLDLEFGEIALFLSNGQLFSISVYAELQRKTANPNDLDDVGGGIDYYINTSGQAEIDLNAGISFGELASLDNLPNASDARYKVYTVPHPKYTDLPILAYRSGNFWGFTGYAVIAQPTILNSTINSVRIQGEFPVTGGDVIQFASGGLQSTARVVQAGASISGSTSISFSSPVTVAPTVGQSIYLLKPAVGISVGGMGGGSGAYLPLDGSQQMTANLNLGGFKATNSAQPVSPADLVNKSYADNLKVPNTQVIPAASGSLNLDCTTYDEFHLTLSGNVMLSLNGGFNSKRILIRIKQDTGGNRSVQLSSNVRYNLTFPSYTASATPNSLDLLGFQLNAPDGKYDLVAMLKGIL